MPVPSDRLQGVPRRGPEGRLAPRKLDVALSVLTLGALTPPTSIGPDFGCIQADRRQKWRIYLYLTIIFSNNNDF